MAASGAKIPCTCSPVRDRCRSHQPLDRVTHSSNAAIWGKINKWPERNWVLPSNNLFFSGNVPFKRIRNTRRFSADRHLFGEKNSSDVCHLGIVAVHDCAAFVLVIRSIRKAEAVAKNKPANCVLQHGNFPLPVDCFFIASRKWAE
jgi:hypothetical protein